MSPAHTVLIVSRYFPPGYDVGGRRAYHFARYLPAHGFQPVVVTGDLPEEGKRDPAPLDLPEGVQLIRAYEPPGRRPRGARLSDGTVAAPVADRTPPTGLRARLGRQLSPPLGGDLWLVPHLVRALERVIAETRPDVIIASSSPYATLVAADLAARRTSVPVCLDLRDPWSLNFLQRDKAAWVRASEAWLERRLFARAARVTFTSEATTRAYRELYPRLGPDHFATVHNAFDPARRPQAAPKSGPLKLVHFGNCYGPRSLGTVLRALAVVVQRRPQAAIELLNLGRVSESDLALADDLGVGQVFRHRPVVPYDEGLSILASSDLPVLLAYGEETLFIPAKFYDYLLAGTKMLCVSRPSELTALVSELDAGTTVGPDDVTAASAAIEVALDARQGGQVRRIDEAGAARFAAPVAAAKLAEVLTRALTARGAASAG